MGKDATSKRKVLLIGLGGTGCRVVSAVKDRIGTRDSSVQCIGFDTDKHEEHMDNLKIVSTSREATVAEMLKRFPDWRTWFPNNPLLLAKNMINGAGQIRALSRLAFMDLLMRNRNGIRELDKAIDSLRNEQGLANDGFKIMIVSSFAGGTGSGMFLHMPLYLRQHIKEKYPGIPVMIRGLFALPDVFMGHENNAIQEESMYANAYACLKELAAINNVCMARIDQMSKYNIKIEPFFDSKTILSEARKANEKKKDNDTPTAARRPYDFIFFVDNVNSNNNSIEGSKETYIEQMADITYMQVYSPMANKTDSREDNLIMTEIESKGRSFYGSAASTLLQYPYDDILQYYSLKATTEMISKRWKYIDEKYEQTKQDVKRKKRRDSSVRSISKSEGFLSEANELINDDTTGFFFLKNAVCENPEDSSSEAVRSDKYADALESMIEDAINDDSVISSSRDNCYNNPPEIDKDAEKEGIIAEIDRAEKNLLYYKATIDKRTQSLYRTLADQFVPDDINSPYVKRVNNIFSMLRMKNEQGKEYGIHPLAVRYLLYSLIANLTAKHTEAQKNLEDAVEFTKAYYSDRDSVRKGKQGPGDMVPDERWGLFRRKNQDALDYFNKIYKKGDLGYDAQLANLDSYCENRLKERVYKEIIDRLQIISSRFEKMFSSLGDVEKGYSYMMEQMEKRFEKPTASNTYLCTDLEYLNALYKRLGVEINEEDSNSLFDTILTTMYKAAMDELKFSAEKDGLNEDESKEREAQLDESMDKTVRDLFKDVILPKNKEQIRRDTTDALDISVYNALQIEVDLRLKRKALAEGKEAELTPNKQDEERQELLMEVYRKTAPYLAYLEYHKPESSDDKDDTGEGMSLDTYYWGINSDVSKTIAQERGDVEQYLSPSSVKPAEISESRMYSKYELQCYRGAYGVQLTEIPKFRESDKDEQKGVYYQHYERRINRMGRGTAGEVDEGISPHIDITWGNLQNMPGIDRSFEQTESVKAARAFWLAVLYHDVCIREVQNGETWKMDAWACFPAFRGDGLIGEEKHRSRPLRFKANPIGQYDFYEMYQAFAQDVITTKYMLESVEDYFEFACGEALKAPEVRFYGGMNANPFTTALIGNTSEESRLEEVDDMTEDKEFNTNVLEIAFRITKDRQASPQDKTQIMKGLTDLIDDFCAKAKLSVHRKADLIWEIFIRSPFVQTRNRRGAEAALIPPFSVAMEKYDRKYGKSKTKATEKGNTAKTIKEESNKSVAKKGGTVKKTSPVKKTSVKANSTAKTKSTTKADDSAKKVTVSKAAAAKKTTTRKTTTDKPKTSTKKNAKKTTTKG